MLTQAQSQFENRYLVIFARQKCFDNKCVDSDISQFFSDGSYACDDYKMYRIEIVVYEYKTFPL